MDVSVRGRAGRKPEHDSRKVAGEEGEKFELGCSAQLYGQGRIMIEGPAGNPLGVRHACRRDSVNDPKFEGQRGRVDNSILEEVIPMASGSNLIIQAKAY